MAGAGDGEMSRGRDSSRTSEAPGWGRQRRWRRLALVTAGTFPIYLGDSSAPAGLPLRGSFTVTSAG
jgi:hypothetical protein